MPAADHGPRRGRTAEDQLTLAALAVEGAVSHEVQHVECPAIQSVAQLSNIRSGQDFDLDVAVMPQRLSQSLELALQVEAAVLVG
jgi:hypothetical protein